MPTQRLQVTAHLASPLVTSGAGFMTLDGLLAALIFDATGSIERSHAEVPIVCTDALYHASGAVLEPIDTGRICFVAQLRPAHGIDPDLILKNKHGQLHRKFDTSLTNVMNTYPVITAPAVTWYCEGEPERIEALLRDAHFIGKRRASGFGSVSRWEVEPGELDGLTGYADEPLRPVPVDRYTGDRSAVIEDAAWRPAYWDPRNRAACFVPSRG